MSTIGVLPSPTASRRATAAEYNSQLASFSDFLVQDFLFNAPLGGLTLDDPSFDPFSSELRGPLDQPVTWCDLVPLQEANISMRPFSTTLPCFLIFNPLLGPPSPSSAD